METYNGFNAKDWCLLQCPVYKVKLILSVVVLISFCLQLFSDQSFSDSCQAINESGIVVVTTNPAGAEIWMAEDLIGISPCNLILPVGKNRLLVKKKGYAQKKCVVVVRINEETCVECNLFTDVTSRLEIISYPKETKGAEVQINGEEQIIKTPGCLQLMPGVYEVTLHHPLFQDASATVELERGKHRILPIALQKNEMYAINKARKWQTNKWISLASTVLCVGAGMYCNMQGDAAFDDYEAATTTADAVSYRDDLESWYDKRDLSYTVSIIPALWSVYSLVKESHYNRQSVRK